MVVDAETFTDRLRVKMKILVRDLKPGTLIVHDWNNHAAMTYLIISVTKNERWQDGRAMNVTSLYTSGTRHDVLSQTLFANERFCYGLTTIAVGQ